MRVFTFAENWVHTRENKNSDRGQNMTMTADRFASQFMLAVLLSNPSSERDAVQT
jgi:hypothetical protein